MRKEESGAEDEKRYFGDEKTEDRLAAWHALEMRRLMMGWQPGVQGTNDLLNGAFFFFFLNKLNGAFTLPKMCCYLYLM